MDSLLAAFVGAQTGQFQLTAAAQLARTDPSIPDTGTSIAKLIGAAQQTMAPLATAVADLGTNLGTNLDISC